MIYFRSHRPLFTVSLAALLTTGCGEPNVKLEEGPALKALPETTKKVEEAEKKLSEQKASQEKESQKKQDFQNLLQLTPAAATPSTKPLVVTKLTTSQIPVDTNQQIISTSAAIVRGTSFVGAAITGNTSTLLEPVRIDLHDEAFIYANRFHLRAHESIFTHGHNLTIVADTVELDGLIQTTPDSLADNAKNAGDLKIFATKLATSSTTRIHLSGADVLSYRGRVSWHESFKEPENQLALAELRPDLFGVNLASDPKDLLGQELHYISFRMPDGNYLAKDQIIESRKRWAPAIYNALFKNISSIGKHSIPSRFRDSFSADADQRSACIDKISNDLSEMTRQNGMSAKLTSTTSLLSQNSGRDYQDLAILISQIRSGVSPRQPQISKTLNVQIPPIERPTTSSSPAILPGQPGNLILVIGRALGQELLYSANNGRTSRSPSKVLMFMESPQDINLTWDSIITADMSWKSMPSGATMTAKGSDAISESQSIRIFSNTADLEAFEQKIIEAERASLDLQNTGQQGTLKAWSAGFENQWIELYERLRSENLPGFNEAAEPFKRFKDLADAQRNLNSH